jgi:hypothetical protein
VRGELLSEGQSEGSNKRNAGTCWHSTTDEHEFGQYRVSSGITAPRFHRICISIWLRLLTYASKHCLLRKMALCMTENAIWEKRVKSSRPKAYVQRNYAPHHHQASKHHLDSCGCTVHSLHRTPHAQAHLGRAGCRGHCARVPPTD